MRYFVILILLALSNIAQAEPTLKLIFPNSSSPTASGNNQFGDTKAELLHPFTVRVINTKNGEGVQGRTIEFIPAAQPNGATKLDIIPSTIVTDATGFASAKVRLGAKQGTYVAQARLVGLAGGSHPDNDSLFFTAYARRANWPFFLTMELMAGLAIFMFGISQLSDGMRKSAGRVLRNVLGTLTKNRLLALCIGALATVVFQSSTATTVMLVGFAQAGIISFAQTLGVILGADIGTTMTVQLIAFKVTDYALVAVAIGFFTYVLVSTEYMKSLGKAVMGIGFVFFGMTMMSESIGPLRTHEPFLSYIVAFHNPIIAVFIGAIFTAILHSSAAFIAIVIAFASQSLIGLPTGVGLILGANIGTCITAVFASFGGSVEAKRVAWGHTLFKIIGVLILIPWVNSFSNLVTLIGGKDLPAERAIANAHTIFNIGIAVIFFPLLNPFAKLVSFLIPEVKKKLPPEEEPVVLDDNLVATPALALSAAKKEVMRLGRKSQKVVEIAFRPLFSNQEFTQDEMESRETDIDAGYETINNYLKKVLAVDGSSERLEEAFQMMNATNDLEQIADIVEKRIFPNIQKVRDQNITLSQDGIKELKEYHTKTLKQISRALDVFESLNLERAKHASQRFEKYRLLADELKTLHFMRIRTDIQSNIHASECHLDLLSALLEISDLATNLARSMLNRIEISDEHLVHSIVKS
jgi:phosphate:Na+ symporter